MRNYEMTLLLSPNTELKEANDAVQRVASFIQEQGGLLGNQNGPSAAKLGSPVQRHGEVLLTSVAFQLAPDKLVEVEKLVQETSPVLRFMLVSKRERREPAARTVAERTPREETRVADAKEIDERLEEIFKEATGQ